MKTVTHVLTAHRFRQSAFRSPLFHSRLPRRTSGITFHGYYNNGSGIAFASNGLSVVDSGVSYGGEPVYNWNSGAVLFGLADYAQGGAGGSIKVVLPSGVNAVAFDTMGYLRTRV